MLKKVILFSVVFVSLILTSCKDKGCTDEVAKNFDETAQKDDETCLYYTNTEFLVDSIWSYSDLSHSNASEEENQKDYYSEATYNFNEDGSLFIYFPQEPSASDVQTWVFIDSDTKIVLNAGTANVDTLDVIDLDIENLTLRIKNASSGSETTVYWKH